MQPLDNRSVLVILTHLVLVILLHEPHVAFPEFKAMSKAAADLLVESVQELSQWWLQCDSQRTLLRFSSYEELGLSHSSCSPLNTI